MKINLRKKGPMQILLLDRKVRENQMYQISILLIALGDIHKSRGQLRVEGSSTK